MNKILSVLEQNLDSVNIDSIHSAFYPLFHEDKIYLVVVANDSAFDPLLDCFRAHVFLDNPYGDGFLYDSNGKILTQNQMAVLKDSDFDNYLGASLVYERRPKDNDKVIEMLSDLDSLAARLSVPGIIVSDAIDAESVPFFNQNLSSDNALREHQLTRRCADLTYKVSQYLKLNPSFADELRITK